MIRARCVFTVAGEMNSSTDLLKGVRMSVLEAETKPQHLALAVGKSA